MSNPLGEKANADAVRESEERYRVLVEGIALAVWETDPTGSQLTDSTSWRGFTGQDAADVNAAHWTDVIHPDDREPLVEQWRRCMQQGTPFNFEYRLWRADGKWIWTQAHAAPLRDAAGNVRKWVGMNLDISQRKEAANQLIMNERQLKLALDISRMSFWNLNPVARHVRMDARMRAMWGETTDEEFLPLDHVLKRIHPVDRPKVIATVEAALDPSGTGLYLPNDYRIVLDDGTIRWLSANGMTMFAGRGGERHATELFGTVLDITQRKLTEASLRESEERLQQLNAQLEDRVRERTQELLASEQRLRATAERAQQVSRQLRSLALELSRTEQRERRQLAHILHDHVQQLLVGAKMRIEALSRDEELRVAQERLVGISTVIDLAINATRSLAIEVAPPLLHSQGLPAALQWLALHTQEQHNLAVEMNIDSSANPRSEESRELLFQASRELLLNAVKHARAQSVKMRLATEGNWIVLEVSDAGVGFDPGSVNGDAPTFGLLHLRERLAAVGGEIRIESKPGQGTRVTVRLPEEP